MTNSILTPYCCFTFSTNLNHMISISIMMPTFLTNAQLSAQGKKCAQQKSESGQLDGSPVLVIIFLDLPSITHDPLPARFDSQIGPWACLSDKASRPLIQGVGSRASLLLV